ncbi:MAG: hypothetical protein ACK4MD_06105 [Demequina sp.]
MTDESRPLSRRERREQAMRDAARPAEDTDALEAPISESIPTHSPEGRVLTRRERRRLERARLPMETWTAEEEMIATGQIPAMTPERIAEQERIAREKAAQAQREAQAASSKFTAPWAAQPAGDVDHGLESQDEHADEAPEPAAPADLTVEPADEPAVEPAVEPADEPADEPAVESPQAFEPEPDATAWEPVAPDAAPQPSVPLRTSLIPSTPGVATSAPDASPAGFDADADEVAGEDADDEPQAPPAQEAVLGMPPGMTPEMFAALFPPGSLQRRLMEQQATEQAEAARHEATAAQPELDDPAAEIRRLTQQAVAGMGTATSRPSASSPADDDSVEPEAADFGSRAVLPHAESPDEEEPEGLPATSPSAGDSAPSPAGGTGAVDDTDTRGPERPAQPWASSAPSSPSSWGEQTAHDLGQDRPTPRVVPPPTDEAPAEAPASLDQTPFDAILGDHPGTAALDQVSTASAELPRPAFHSVQAQRSTEVATPRAPHYAAFDVPQASTDTADLAESPWATHPLMRVDRPAPELPEVESTKDIPRPDLSSVRRPAFAPQSGGIPAVEPVPTGQIEVPPRERPDLAAEGGPRHFKWAHLAVFGAVAFLLGVVVWNVAVRP